MMQWVAGSGCGSVSFAGDLFLMSASRHAGCPGAQSATTPREIKPSLFIRLQNEAARGGQSAVKLAGGNVASLFASDAGWSTGHLLLVAARAEDERDAGFNSTYCT